MIVVLVVPFDSACPWGCRGGGEGAGQKKSVYNWMFGGDQAKNSEFGVREEYDNIIKQTRNMIRHMTTEQRFQKAKAHVMDALRNRPPRPMSHSPLLTPAYHTLHFLQSSVLWQWALFLLSYLYVYLAVLDSEHYVLKLTLESTLLTVFLFDTFIDYFLKSFDQFRKKNKYPSFFLWKTLLLVFMAADLLLFALLPCPNSRPIRPFRLLRAFLPLCFDPQIRKSLLALASAYKQIIVFIIYYAIIIVGFAFIGSQALTFDPAYVDPSSPLKMDAYISNYGDLKTMIFNVYAMGTYDYFPDHQQLAVQNYQPNYLYFIVFVFFNMFLFASIPGSLIYNKFRETRSKYILVDEIKQQHSLILGFVSLAQEENNLSIEELIQFLFSFYRKKIRYVEYITEICLKLDANNNQTIQVNEFMQLTKIMLYNSIMFPPAFQDLQPWIHLRTALNDSLQLKAIVTHPAFQLVTAVLIALCFANTVILLFDGPPLTVVFDQIFVWVFVGELVLRIVGVGPENFFADRWNSVDAFLMAVNVVFLFVSTGTRIDNLFKINRMLRMAGPIRTVLHSKWVQSFQSQMLGKFKRLFSTFLQILPIIVRFFLLFAFFFYIFGIIGMEIFYNSETRHADDSSAYNVYKEHSNFGSFLHSQYLMMQVLTEGGWSVVGLDYCQLNPDYYALVTLFFVVMHLTIVTVNATLLKGIFWEIYFTVSSMMDDIDDRVHQQAEKEADNELKTKEIDEIHQQLNNNQSLEPNTIIRREIIEKKLDLEILRRIQIFDCQQEEEGRGSEKSLRSINRSKIVEQIMENWNISAKELQNPCRKRKYSLSSPKLKRKKAVVGFKDIEDKEEEDFEEEMEEILNRLIISSKIKYSEIIAYPKIFTDFLRSKFRHPEEFLTLEGFDINEHPLGNQESMDFHIYEMNGILGLENTRREKKTMIVDCLAANGYIDDATAQKMVKTNLLVEDFHVDTNGALRKMYLSETNEALIKKLEVEYFSDVYGNSFKRINKVTLQPLLKFEASLTYSLWNILSYPQIEEDDFFLLLTHIEDQMSNKLLKVGSLLKFVYKVDHESDIWFLIEQKKHQEAQVRFIKTGLWTYTEDMRNGQPHYARDIFHWDLDELSAPQAETCQQYLKLFYQSFQTLAFSLIDKKPFFESNPREHIYDLYTQNFEVGGERRSGRDQLGISNIMLVILSKEEERNDVGEQNLPYHVSDIRSQRRRRKKEDFILDEDEKETFEKLKNLAAMDHEKIIESEGLPFSYVINLMRQISDLLQLYRLNFASHAEKALNAKYQEVNCSADQEEIISLPEIVVQLSH